MTETYVNPTSDIDLTEVETLLAEAQASDQATRELLQTVQTELVQAEAANLAAQSQIDTEFSAALDQLEAEEAALLAEAEQLTEGE